MSRTTFLELTYRQSNKACATEDMPIVESVSVKSTTEDIYFGSTIDLIDRVFKDGWNAMVGVDIQDAKAALLDSVGEPDEGQPMTDLQSVMHAVLDGPTYFQAKVSRILKRVKITDPDTAQKKRDSHKSYITLKKLENIRTYTDGVAIVGEFQEWRWNKKRRNYFPHKVGYRLQRITDNTLIDGFVDVGTYANGDIATQKANTMDAFRFMDSDIQNAMHRLIPHYGYHRIAIGSVGAHIVSAGQA